MVYTDIRRYKVDFSGCRVNSSKIFFKVAPYLVAIIEAYLRNRTVKFVDRKRVQHRKEVYCRVPQGSALGPLLWNLAYDAVLRTNLPSGRSIICIADDTLILAHRARVICVVDKIRGLCCG